MFYWVMCVAKMYDKGIVAIPKHICEEAGVQKGSELIFKAVRRGQIMIMAQDDWLEEFDALCKEGATATGKEVDEGIKRAKAKLHAKWLNVPRR